MIDAKGNFPSGLLLRVESFIKPLGAYKTVDKRGPPPPYRPLVTTSFEHPPYAAQTQAVTAALKAGRGIVSAPTGTGKSRIIAMLVAAVGLKTLVVVPSLEIKKQLTQGLIEALGSLKDITVANIDSVPKGDFSVLIIDEAHRVAAKTYQKLNKSAWTGIYYRWFLSATPFRNDTEETLLFEGIAGQVVFKLSYKDAVKQGLIVPVEAYVIDLPKVETDAFTWQQVYSELVVNNVHRNEVIAIIASRLRKQGKSTLVLVKEVSHVEHLVKLGGFPHAHGQDTDSRNDISLFNQGKIDVLVGTEGILGEGVDTKPCEYVIIAGLGKAKSAFMQKVGRAVRKYPGKESAKVILFRDTSHKFLSRHYKAQVRILKDEYGIKPTKIDL